MYFILSRVCSHDFSLPGTCVIIAALSRHTHSLAMQTRQRKEMLALIIIQYEKNSR